MRKLLKRIALFLLLLGVTGEIFFRTVLPASAPPYKRYFPNEKITLYDADKQSDGLFAVGNLNQVCYRWHINHLGCVSSREYSRNSSVRPGIAIIGDSNMEGFYVDRKDHASNVLDSLLGQSHQVCTFAFQGSFLSHYTRLMEFAKEKVDPSIYVLLLKEDEFFGSSSDLRPNPFYLQYRQTESNQFELVEPKPFPHQWKVQLLRWSTVIRYLSFNRELLGIVSPGATVWASYVADTNGQSEQAKREQRIRDGICDLLLVRLLKIAEGCPIYLICDSELREEMYLGKIVRPSLTYRMLRERSLPSNIHLIDFVHEVETDYAIHHQRVNYTFNNHLNAYGHRLLARSIANVLTDTANSHCQ